jgi:hypothetical protein
VLCTLLGWGLILVLIKPDDVDHIPAVMYKHSGPITSKRNLTVIALCVSISFLFATSQFTKDYIGDIGILSLAFIVVVFGTGLLSEVHVTTNNDQAYSVRTSIIRVFTG